MFSEETRIETDDDEWPQIIVRKSRNGAWLVVAFGTVVEDVLGEFPSKSEAETFASGVLAGISL